jgi:sulfide dehydrogenase cytochrome subunit
LKYTLLDFKEGRREMPKKMKEKLDAMVKKEEKKGDKGGREALEALLAYYASQQ